MKISVFERRQCFFSHQRQEILSLLLIQDGMSYLKLYEPMTPKRHA
ncbi:hypothetical protein BBOMB_1575 [Bifidobacterium bombi DSM 19703]|uniref:Uncharacterized protein n=1 Tax=Bifidobacterium bombi DSM 19703 TaxID=1341695 RepID=A0A086BND4_9BIFI|nr:hypothetical protein BBOMB_1575 [Bifidobacterium bombi DSM 19703]